MKILSAAALTLMLCAAPSFGQSTPAFQLSQLTPIVYNDLELKSFLANFLKLTPAQMVQCDLAFAEARARLYPLEESIKSTHAKLETALAGGSPVTSWKPLVTRLGLEQTRVLEVEFTALQKFHQLLDGDQRYRLTQLPAAIAQAQLAQAQDAAKRNVMTQTNEQ